MKSKWSKEINKFYPVQTASIQPKLDNGVYMFRMPPLSPSYFEKIRDNFTFDYKIYGLRTELINRTLQLWKNTTGNIGILLNGTKGTGKSVTSQIVCNNMIENFDMPVLLINEPYENLADILALIPQDIVVMIDEFEKVFSTTDMDGSNVDLSQRLLSLMDGAMASEYRRLFVFTTNKKWIDENLLQRPGRLRYVVEFNDLKLSEISEIVDDLLIYPEFKEDTISFISTLEIITVDIVKSIIQEVNIFKESPENFKHIFNVQEKSDTYNIYIDDKMFIEYASISPSNIFDKKIAVGKNFYINNECVGEIVKLDNINKKITIKNHENKKVEYTVIKTKTYHANFRNSEFAF